MTAFEAGKLRVNIYENREELGAAAAEKAAAKINELLENRRHVNIVFAAAASQNEFLASLLQQKVEWQRVNAFHMDEYIGLERDAPQQFGIWLRERIFGKLPFRTVFYLNGQAEDLQEECTRYSGLLRQYPLDITFMGIGENTHLAFNDPHVAEFKDPYLVKVVDIDDRSKQQQVNEGCFGHLSEVPSDAFTLTIPALLHASYVYCMVPGERKANAVRQTLKADISEKYPSTILRTHSHAELFLDKESAMQLGEEKESELVIINKK